MPMAICVDHPPPNATSAKTIEPAPPIDAVVVVDELLTVAGGETFKGGEGVGGKPRPNPGCTPEIGSVDG